MVKFVNNVVMVVVEKLGGMEYKFVVKMIVCVCVLGFKRIKFNNVFGLLDFG